MSMTTATPSANGSPQRLRGPSLVKRPKVGVAEQASEHERSDYWATAICRAVADQRRIPNSTEQQLRSEILALVKQCRNDAREP